MRLFDSTLLFLFLVLAPASLTAQIFADVSVSDGETSLGTFRIRLHHEQVPRTVANFVGLATGERKWIDPRSGSVRSGVPYYDGLTFHRLAHDFMIQGGDPLGTGGGGPGFIFQDEFDPDLRHDGSYVVSMANSGVNSNGSQFFITLGSAPWLDDMHSIFGEVINDETYPNSRDVVDAFRSAANFPTPRSSSGGAIKNDNLIDPVTIDSIVISGPDLADFEIDDPQLQLPEVSAVPLEIIHDAPNHQFSLKWDRRNRWDYPLYYGSDLKAWFVAGNLLSMGDEADFQVDVSVLATESKGFFKGPAVDYSLTPVLPGIVFSAGSRFVLVTQQGQLTLEFDGAESGTWQFEDEESELSSGSLTDVFVPQTPMQVPPSPSYWIHGPGQSYARGLSAREVVIYFDGPVGPNQLTAIQPSFSFHTETSGWFNGPLLSNLDEPAQFKGTFDYIPGL